MKSYTDAVRLFPLCPKRFMLMKVVLPIGEAVLLGGPAVNTLGRTRTGSVVEQTAGGSIVELWSNDLADRRVYGD
jgi:hypothetical protein